MSRIANALVMDPDDIEQTYADVSSGVMRDLDRQGIYIPADPDRDRPRGYEGEIPEDLDVLSNDDLANLMVRHQSWTAYLNGCASAAAASKKVAERALKGIKNEIELSRGKEYVYSDPRFIRADAALLYHELKVDIITDVLKNARNAYQLMSRLVALREQDQQQTTRRNVLTSSRKRSRP